MPPTNSYGRTLDQILALKHPDARRMRAKFMDELRDYVLEPPGRRAAGPLALPPRARLVSVLDIIRLEAGGRGLWLFLHEEPDAGDYLAAGVEACERVGATGSAAHLRAALATFPGGQVPRERRALRRVLDRLGVRDGPLHALDERYRAELGGEIPDRLRDFVARHKDAFEAEAAGAPAA